MYAVIFKATFKNIAALDDEYFTMAKRLQQRAKEQYGCQDFVSTTEGNQEIAISYWHSIEDIKNWKADPLHSTAQVKGAQDWYASYTVEVVEVIKNYNM